MKNIICYTATHKRNILYLLFGLNFVELYYYGNIYFIYTFYIPGSKGNELLLTKPNVRYKSFGTSYLQYLHLFNELQRV